MSSKFLQVSSIIQTQLMSTNAVCAEHQYFNGVKLLHYWKVKRFARSAMMNLLYWILWIIWMIRMMSRCHEISCKPCKPILSEYWWIYHKVSRRNSLEGKQYHFLKVIQIDEKEYLSGKWRTKILYKELQVRDHERLVMVIEGWVKKPRKC